MTAFRDKNNAHYVTVDNGHGGNETMRIGSTDHKNNIIKEAIRAGYPAPDKKDIMATIDEVRTEAIMNEVQQEVYVRIGPHGDNVIIDLAGKKGLAVQITPEGVSVCKPPIPFIRPNGVEGLPKPDFTGSHDRLAQFLPGLTENQYKLVIVWILAAMLPRGPFPILLLSGVKGAAKSSMAKILRKIIDPSTVPLQSLPRDERNLMIAANNSWLLNFDNSRQVGVEVSDCLCRLSTGGGLRLRKLYANDEEAIFSACRPIIINGINNVIGETDLLDRTLFIELPAITVENRRTEKELLTTFISAVPSIFGGFCQTLSKVLRMLPRVKTQNLPRMADFAVIGIAVEMALEWEQGTFLRIYEENRDLALNAVADNDPLAHAITKLVQRSKEWQGTSTALLEALAPYRTRGIVDWPLTPRALSVKLRSLAGGLQGSGITLEFDINIGTQKRLILIRRENTVPEPSPAPLSIPGIVPVAVKQPEAECSAAIPLGVRGDIKGAVNIRSCFVQ